MAGFDVNAFVLRQKNHELYLFSLSSEVLDRIAYVTPRSNDDPNEIQRILKKRHTKEIAKYIEDPTPLLPTAVVVSLAAEVGVQSTGDPNLRVITFPEETGKFAYVLDG